MWFILLSLFLSPCSSQSTVYSSWINGNATKIDATLNTCQYTELDREAIFPYKAFAAINSAKFNDAAMCGACFEMRCTGSSSCCDGGLSNITIQVTSECKDTACNNDPNGFELSETAFDGISDWHDTSCDSISIEYRRVSCDIPSENIEITNIDGIVANGNKYGLWLARVAGIGTIGRVQVLDSGSTAINIGWVDLIHDSDNYWTNTSIYQWSPPFDVRITSTNDAILNSSNVVTTMNARDQFDFGQNFEVSCVMLPCCCTRSECHEWSVHLVCMFFLAFGVFFCFLFYFIFR